MTSSTSVKFTKKLFLPALTSPEDWESENRLGGLKTVMKQRLHNVRAQIRVNIRN